MFHSVNSKHAVQKDMAASLAVFGRPALGRPVGLIGRVKGGEALDVDVRLREAAKDGMTAWIIDGPTMSHSYS